MNFFLLKAFISPEVTLCYHHGYFIIKVTRGIFYCQITGESNLASSIQTHITTRHLTSWVQAKPSDGLIPSEMEAFTLLQLFSAELWNGFWFKMTFAPCIFKKQKQYIISSYQHWNYEQSHSKAPRIKSNSGPVQGSHLQSDLQAGSVQAKQAGGSLFISHSWPRWSRLLFFRNNVK